MNVLDELRDRLYGHLTGAGWLAEKYLTEDLRAFEAEHPGLVDHTRRCCNCGAAWSADDAPMLGTWSVPGAMLADVAMVGPHVRTEDHRIHGTEGLWLCSACADGARPACAKEATA